MTPRPSAHQPVTPELDFVIIGAQKGGSTQLARGVREHPEIWMPKSETPVFRDPLYSAADIAAFRDLVGQQRATTLRGIKCPDYLARPEVPARLLAQRGRPKLVVCLRDPVERAVSTYFWHVRWGLLPIEDPSIGLEKVLDGRYADRDPRSDEVVEWSLYGKHLDHYLTHFGRDEIHVLFSDDLRRDPHSAYSSTFSFLGVDATFRPPAEAKSANEGVYSRQRLKFLNLRNRFVLRWSADRTYVDIQPATGVFPRLASRSVAGIDRFILSRIFTEKKPTITPEVTERLRKHFAADTARLEEILHRDLGAWK